MTPVSRHPAIADCLKVCDYTCFKSVASLVNLTCAFTNARPAVNLRWKQISLGGYELLTSNGVNYTENKVTYTSILETTFLFKQSSLLSLLVCEAFSVPLTLMGHSKVVIEKLLDYRSHMKPITMYPKVSTSLNLPCKSPESHLIIWKLSSKKEKRFEILHVSAFESRNDTNMNCNEEYTFDQSGSLSIQRILIKNEGLYVCTFDDGSFGGIRMYDVTVIGMLI